MRLTTLVLVVAALSLRPEQRPSEPARPPLWQVPGEGQGVPAVDATTVYALTTRHQLVALDAGNGAARWITPTLEGDDGTQGTRVVVSGDVVIAGDYDIFGFDRSTGQRRWRFTPSAGYGPGIYLGNVTGGLIVAGSPAGRIYAIDTLTGAERWSTVVSSDGKSTAYAPVSDGELTVASHTTFAAPPSGGVVALESSTGRERWRAPFPSSSTTAPGGAASGAVFAGDVVVAASSDGVIHGFDRLSGLQRWSLPSATQGGSTSHLASVRDFRALTVAGDTLVAGSLSGEVIAYNVRTRRELWRRPPSPRVSTAFSIVADGCCAYVPYMDGTVAALDLVDGSQRWRVGDWKLGFAWPPAMAVDRVFLASARAGFFAFSR